MRTMLAVLTLGAVLASVAPMAWAGDNVDPSFPSADSPAAAVAAASGSGVAGPSLTVSLPYAQTRQENREH